MRSLPPGGHRVHGSINRISAASERAAEPRQLPWLSRPLKFGLEQLRSLKSNALESLRTVLELLAKNSWR